MTNDANLKHALSLLLGGEIDPGLARYRIALRGDGPSHVPVGSHILFLERSGRAEAAAALASLAVRRGADVALHPLALGADPARAAADYEALFARGVANSRMVTSYAVALSRLGRTAETEALLDPDRLLRRVRIAAPEPGSVRSLLLESESRARFQAATQSVRGMRKLERFHSLDDPAATALVAALEAESRRYLSDWAASAHALAPLVPRTARLRAWGLISRGEGFNAPHIHHKGWATGVYYPAGPEGGGEGGALRIGPPPALGEQAPGWPDVTIRPEPGLLVLIPSFYTHWTIPLGRPGLRLSIAFDLISTARRRRPIDEGARLR